MLEALSFGGAPVLVTGAAAGIGLGASEALAELGARVIGVDMNTSFGEASSAGAAAGEAPDCFHSRLVADVSVEDQVIELVHAVGEEYGQLAAVVNAAGGSSASRVEQTSLGAWDKTIANNLTSVFLMTRECLPLLAVTGGALVNVSSTYAFSSRAGQSAYSAAKAGIVGFTRAVAIEGAPRGVRANAVCPGPVETPRRLERFASGADSRATAEGRTLLGRMASVAEVGSLIAFLASRASSYVTGAAFVIDGGQLVHIGNVS